MFLLGLKRLLDVALINYRHNPDEWHRRMLSMYLCIIVQFPSMEAPRTPETLTLLRTSCGIMLYHLTIASRMEKTWPSERCTAAIHPHAKTKP